MALTRSFRETIYERAQNDPEFRHGLLTEAVECLLNNEVEESKSLLRDYVNVTIGFEALADQLDKDPSSLMRMLSSKGNPTISNMSQLLSAVRQHEGIDVNVTAG